jgi:hypothetical protein
MRRSLCERLCESLCVFLVAAVFRRRARSGPDEFEAVGFTTSARVRDL